MSNLKLIVITYCIFLLPFIILCASPNAYFNLFAGFILVPGLCIGISKVISGAKYEKQKDSDPQTSQQPKRYKTDPKYLAKVEEERRNETRAQKRSRERAEYYIALRKEYKAANGKYSNEAQDFGFNIQAWQYVNRNWPCLEGEEDEGVIFGVSDEGIDIRELRQRIYPIIIQMPNIRGGSKSPHPNRFAKETLIKSAF